MATPKAVYKIIFEAQLHSVPEVIRLRRLLKAALRSFGFRCVTVERVKIDAKGARYAIHSRHKRAIEK